MIAAHGVVRGGTGGNVSGPDAGRLAALVPQGGDAEATSGGHGDAGGRVAHSCCGCANEYPEGIMARNQRPSNVWHILQTCAECVHPPTREGGPLEPSQSLIQKDPVAPDPLMVTEPNGHRRIDSAVHQGASNSQNL